MLIFGPSYLLLSSATKATKELYPNYQISMMQIFLHRELLWISETMVLIHTWGQWSSIPIQNR